MNYQIMEKMKDYEPDSDSMLFHLPLAGSALKFTMRSNKWRSKFVPADDLIVPYQLPH